VCQGRIRKSTIASRRALGDSSRLDEHDPTPGITQLCQQRRPQPSEAATDDRQIGLFRAG
jgi:hypothetical protein